MAYKKYPAMNRRAGDSLLSVWFMSGFAFDAGVLKRTAGTAMTAAFAAAPHHIAYRQNQQPPQDGREQDGYPVFRQKRRHADPSFSNNQQPFFQGLGPKPCAWQKTFCSKSFAFKLLYHKFCRDQKNGGAPRRRSRLAATTILPLAQKLCF